MCMKKDKQTEAQGTCATTMMSAFPDALTNDDLVSRVQTMLSVYGYGKSTLLATSLCCDEVNRELEKDLGKVYNDTFSMGGLAGFAFGGVTSFGAMASHIPEGGSCLIVYGPHVGVDKNGVVGKVNRRGVTKTSTCCGSGAAAAAYVESVRLGKTTVSDPPTECLDAQQSYVNSMLLPHGERLEKAADLQVELPMALYDAQDELMKQIVSKGCGKVAGNGKIALLGGIQINTPEGTPDYFLPLKFHLLNNKGKVVDNLIDAFEGEPRPVVGKKQLSKVALLSFFVGILFAALSNVAVGAAFGNGAPVVTPFWNNSKTITNGKGRKQRKFP